MPESPSHAPRLGWRILAVAGASAVALAAAGAATGGIDWSIGSLLLRVHQPWRLLVAGLCLIAAACWLGGAEAKASLSRAWGGGYRMSTIVGMVLAAHVYTVMFVNK